MQIQCANALGSIEGRECHHMHENIRRKAGTSRYTSIKTWKTLYHPSLLILIMRFSCFVTNIIPIKQEEIVNQ